MKYEKAYHFTVTIVRFCDGDTVEVFTQCDCCGACRRERVRLPFIESWEIRSADRDRAVIAARTLTEKYRGQSGVLVTKRLRRDQHSRIVADILLGNESLSVLVVNDGQAWYVDTASPHRITR